MTWRWDEVEHLHVDRDRGLAVSPGVLDELGAPTPADAEERVSDTLMRRWFERRYGPVPAKEAARV